MGKFAARADLTRPAKPTRSKAFCKAKDIPTKSAPQPVHKCGFVDRSDAGHYSPPPIVGRVEA
eukprot:1312113-Amphidinium_carterae.1